MSLEESDPLDAYGDKTRSPLAEFLRRYKWPLVLDGVGILFLLGGAVVGDTLGGIMGAYGVVLILLGVISMTSFMAVRYRLNA